MACLRNLAIGVLTGLGRSTSLLPYAATPATLPGPYHTTLGIIPG
jgi:hypothetical protein